MELFAADGHDAGGCERVTGKSGMRPHATVPADYDLENDGQVPKLAADRGDARFQFPSLLLHAGQT